MLLFSFKVLPAVYVIPYIIARILLKNEGFAIFIPIAFVLANASSKT